MAAPHRGVLTSVCWGGVLRGVRGKVISVMRNGWGGLNILFGSSDNVGVGRGLAEFRAGRPVLIANGETLITLPVEGLDAKRLRAFWELCEPIPPRLVITARRARSLGIAADAPIALELTPDIDPQTILALVADAKAADHALLPEQIGRASCRERAETAVGGVALKKKRVTEGRG